MERILKNVDAYGRFTQSMWAGPLKKRCDASLAVMALGLGGEAGEVQEHIKKFIRDGKLDKEALLKELGDATYYAFRIGLHFGFQPSDILAANVKKLRSRLRRGTTRGSGDNR